MMFTKWFGLMSAAALVGAVALTANGCSSSSSNNTTGDDGGGTDGNVITHHDSGSGSGGDDGSATDDGGSEGGVYDGLTGKTCMSDSDCKNPNGANNSRCSIDAFQSGDALFPTPVCLMAANCDPGQDNNIHFCDGPDQPTSPGVCLPLNGNSATTPKGLCLPQCTFKPDGSAAQGCQGKDTCFVYGFNQDPMTMAVTGIGYCFGGCDTDSDCPGGQKCQADEGLCVKTTTTDLPGGTGCNANATPAPACNCIPNSAGQGYCGSFCKVGGNECPSGWNCDTSLPLTLIDNNDASIMGWTQQNSGLAGFCAPKCTVDGGANFDGGVCPPNSTCQNVSVGGPDCLP